MRNIAVTISCLGFAWLVATTGAEAAPFTFTKIADTAGPYSIFGFPAVNDTGTVAFQAGLHAGGFGIFTIADGVTTAIADDSSFPAINNAGTVAFKASLGSGPGIYSGSGGTLTNIANDSGPLRFDFGAPAINDAGIVAFKVGLDVGGFGIFTGTGGVLAPIAETGAETGPLFSNLSDPSINNAGTVAFGASLGSFGGSGIFTSTNGTLTTVLTESGSQFDSLLGLGAINDAGTVAFGAGLDAGGSGIFTISDGAITTVVDNSGPFSFFEALNFNNGGRVAFKAGFDTGGSGIFAGGDASADAVIKIGDVLDGKTVTNLFLSGGGLNDSGQIAFLAFFDDGSKGIYLADPLFDDIISNFAAQLVTGSPTSISQTVDTGADPTMLSFDYLFETTTGVLDVLLGGATLGTISAPGTLASDFMTASFLVDGGLLDQAGLTLQFLLDGPTGSSLLLDNIVFPGLENGDFEGGDLAGWAGSASGAGFVGAVRLTEVPEPATLALFAFGLAGLVAVRRRSVSKP